MNAANAAAEASMALDAQGTLAARPAASKRGKYYYATDTGQFFRDTGSAWVQFPTLGVTNVFTAAQSIIADGSSDQLKLDTTAASGSATLLVRRRTAADLSTWRQSQITVSATRAAFLAQANTDAGNGYRNDFTGMSGRWGINWNADTIPDDTLVIKNRSGTEVARFVENGGLSVGVGSAPVANLDVRTQSAGVPGLRVGGPVVSGHDYAYCVTPLGAADVVHTSGSIATGGLYSPKAVSTTIYRQVNDNHYWYGDTGLAINTPFTPTVRARLGGTGEFYVRECWVGQTLTDWGYRGIRQRAGTTATEIVNSGGGNTQAWVVFATSDGGFAETGRFDLNKRTLQLGPSIDMTFAQPYTFALQDIPAGFAGNPVNGGFLYSDAGRLAWRGSAGTTTILAPA